MVELDDLRHLFQLNGSVIVRWPSAGFAKATRRACWFKHCRNISSSPAHCWPEALILARHLQCLPQPCLHVGAGWLSHAGDSFWVLTSVPSVSGERKAEMTERVFSGVCSAVLMLLCKRLQGSDVSPLGQWLGGSWMRPGLDGSALPHHASPMARQLAFPVEPLFSL